jgi:hypothetical protein
MAEIVQLAQYREQIALRDGFRLLQYKFDEDFDACTRLADLSANVLYALARPDDGSTQMLNAMILGFLGFGAAARFDGLDSTTQKDVVDLHLFISDQIRFQIMYRLGWLGQVPGCDLPLFVMVRKSDGAKRICQQNPPRLSSNHPDYPSYLQLIDRDQQVYIRRLMPSALEVFKQANGL